MIIFDSSSQYINSQKSNLDKIKAIDKVIAALMDQALLAAANEGITEYSFDDGQVKIQEMYRGTEAVMRSVYAFERLKNYYQNKINGRVSRAIDSKNFRRTWINNGR